MRVPHSVVLASGEDSVCVPLADEGVGFGPSSSSGPVASRPPLADRSASAASSTSGGGCRRAGFARWPSSGTACRLQWATWSGCRALDHSFSRPSMA